MNHGSTIFVGLDVHKEFISVAYVPDDRHAEVTFVGPIGTRECDIDRLIRRLWTKAKQLIFAYEARPSGCGLYRYLRKIRIPLSGSRALAHSQEGGESGQDRSPGRRPIGSSHAFGRPFLCVCSRSGGGGHSGSVSCRGGCPAGPQGREIAPQGLPAASGHLSHRPGRLDSCAPALARRGGLSHSGSADRLSGVCSHRHRTHGTPPTAGNGAPRTGRHLEATACCASPASPSGASSSPSR